MKNVLVSIIVPVFNEENNIKKIVNNLLNQQFKEFEVIFINDGSTDCTETKIKEIEDIYVEELSISYYYQDNSGVGSARNKGINKAIGKYVCFLDADDRYDSTFLKELVRKIEITKSNVCYCGYKIVTPSKTKFIKSRFTKKNLLENYILGKTKIHTDSWMVERKFILEKGIYFYEESNWGEDFYFFCLLLSFHPSVSFVRKFLTNYYVGFDEDRLSCTDLDMIVKDILIIETIINKLKLENTNSIYKALVNYRLPSLLLNRFILLSKEKSIDRLLLKKMSIKYKKYYSKQSYRYGIPSIKQLVRKIQFKLLIK